MRVPAMLRPVARLLGRPWRLLATVVALLAGVAAVLFALSFLRGGSSYQFSARFASAQGVFPGTPVSVLGVKVGSVRQVQFQGSSVLVTIEVTSTQALPAAVDAQLVEPELLGEPDIDLSPGYVSGARLAAGTVIPETRTEVPATTDQLLSQLERVLGAIKPSSARQLVESLAGDLQGEGSQINSLLSNAASTVSLLAAKGDDIGRLDGELATLMGSLRTHDTELANLVTAYDTVSAVLADHQQQLGQAITQLADASQALAGVLSPNLHPIEQDVAVITTVGRTLDRNLGSLDTAIASSASLFTAAHRAYDPVQNWLDLNDQLSPGMTGGVLEGLVRDRLAGVCRRVLAHHSAGLSAQALSTLATCGNPNSGYFDPILAVIGRVLDGLPGGVPPTPSLSQAVGTIPGLTPAQRSKVSSEITSPPAAPTPASKLSTAEALYRKYKISLAALDKVIDSVLGALPGAGSLLPPPAAGATGTTGAGVSGATGTTGLGGLLGVAAGAPTVSGPDAWSSYLGTMVRGDA
jgi:phospholipid/cholesterol/gamma-HCH transport system substrate-binding protein